MAVEHGNDELDPGAIRREDISHALRTPLTTIRLVLERLGRDDGNGLKADGALSLVQQATAQTKVLERLIEVVEREFHSAGMHDHAVVLTEEVARPRD